MAGFVFVLDNIDALKYCFENGIYSTNLKKPTKNKWKTYHEGTFADYISMKPGDNIYFFIKRKIYGIGKLIKLGQDCKYQNYPEALIPTIKPYNKIKNYMLLDDENNINNRLICIFKPYPKFFQIGIDIDDVLSSNPSSFKILRAFWKLSFIKIDDKENKALRDIILKRNEDYIEGDLKTFDYKKLKHASIRSKINKNYKVSSKEILAYACNNNKCKHEMALEAGIIDILSSKNDSIFGKWDYISHQVIASPFKPIDYMDKMDVFGYKYIKGFDTISKYLIIENKRDKAKVEAIDQIMKYVDWVNQEYSYGDYSMIEAFLVAYNFSKEVIDYKNRTCIRNYSKGYRPTIPGTWTNVNLIQYIYNKSRGELTFKKI